jgi:hypothetical protein
MCADMLETGSQACPQPSCADASGVLAAMVEYRVELPSRDRESS